MSQENEKVVARDKKHLIDLIKQEMNKKRGGNYECDLNFIDVSNVTDMSELFSEYEHDGRMTRKNSRYQFNGDISGWNVSNVTNMERMFAGSKFKGDISKWEINTEKVNVEDSYIYRIPSSHRPKFKPIIANDDNIKGLVKKFIDQIGDAADLNFIDVSNVTNMEGLFECSDFNGDIGGWNVSNVTNMKGMFADSKFNGDISEWDVSNVANMERMFAGSEFNGDISSWEINAEKVNVEDSYIYRIPSSHRPKLKPVVASNDSIKDLVEKFIGQIGDTADLNFIDVSNVTSMNGLFEGSDFNGDISGWNVSNVTNMERMFANSKFNGDISKWNVSKVTDMGGLFKGRGYLFREDSKNPFNGDISKWDVSSVKNMKSMFENSIFNGDVSGWNVSNVINMERMFADSKFEGNISSWKININTTATENMQGFRWTLSSHMPTLLPVTAGDNNIKVLVQRAVGAYGYYADLNFIDVSNVTSMERLFAGSKFNGDISKWDVFNVTNMKEMFAESKFNDDISKWDVSKVVNMEGLFAGSEFNGDISKWNVSNVTNMKRMFAGSKFNDDISKWDVSKVTNMEGMFEGVQEAPRRTEGQWLDDEWYEGEWVDGEVTKNPFNGDISGWKIDVSKTATYGMLKLCGIRDLHRPTFLPVMADDNNIKDFVRKAIDMQGRKVDLNFIDVSNVTNMAGLFAGLDFNGDISKWNVSNVTNMKKMFAGSLFNGDISKWDVSKVTNMEGMFDGVYFDQQEEDEFGIERNPFNGDVSKWNVSNVTNMKRMFAYSEFNGDISSWEIDINKISTEEMLVHCDVQFEHGPTLLPVTANDDNIKVLVQSAIGVQGCKADLNFIDVSKVTNMAHLFAGSNFNGDISKWDVSNVTNMESMFDGVRWFDDEAEAKINPFNGDVSKWDVSNVTNMDRMFAYSRFNGNISSWIISISKTTTRGMLASCNIQYQHRPTLLPVMANDDNIKVLVQSAIGVHGFRADLSFIDVSNVTNMANLFEKSEFNGDISKWDVSHVTNMESMFAGEDDWNEGLNNPFDGDLSSWKIAIDKVNTWNIFKSCYISSRHMPTLMPVMADDDSISDIVERSVNLLGYGANLNFIDVSNVTDVDLNELLLNLSDDYDCFYGDVSGWKISNVDLLKIGRFIKETECKYDISNWKFKTIVANNDNIKEYVSEAISILGPEADLSFIDVSKVTNMAGLFENSTFNGNVSGWNVSCVVKMDSLFKGSLFKGDISGWDVSNVTNMSEMFKSSAFDGNITKWKVYRSANVSGMFTGSQIEKNQCIPRWFFEAIKKNPEEYYKSTSSN